MALTKQLLFILKLIKNKKGITPEGYFEYTVFPLEGHWNLDEQGRKSDYLNKEHLVYKLMIRQPDFVTEELFHYALNSVKQKKTNIDLDDVQFELITEGLCVQAMHISDARRTAPEKLKTVLRFKATEI